MEEILSIQQLLGKPKNTALVRKGCTTKKLSLLRNLRRTTVDSFSVVQRGSGQWLARQPRSEDQA